MKICRFLLVPILAALTFASAPARAVPELQLDILGGTYDSTTQTIMSASNSFALYAYSLSLPGSFFLSMALVPAVTAGNYGSFTVNGSTINVTGDMTFGTPPLETILGGAETDRGDLPTHGMYPTYFAEQMFTFSAADQSGLYNTQDQTGAGPQAGTGMYFARFDFDLSGLAAGFGLHFDLYNESIISYCKNRNCTIGDIDVNKFAPFSHDAQAMVTAIPEPETYAMLLVGLGLMAFVARRRRQGLAAV